MWLLPYAETGWQYPQPHHNANDKQDALGIKSISLAVAVQNSYLNSYFSSVDMQIPTLMLPESWLLWLPASCGLDCCLPKSYTWRKLNVWGSPLSCLLAQKVSSLHYTCPLPGWAETTMQVQRGQNVLARSAAIRRINCLCSRFIEVPHEDMVSSKNPQTFVWCSFLVRKPG